MANLPTTANETPRPNPNEKLVRVFDTKQESEAWYARLLESAGIDSDLTSLEANQDVLPGVGGTIILTREEDADRAQSSLRNTGRHFLGDETAEITIPEDLR